VRGRNRAGALIVRLRQRDKRLNRNDAVDRLI